MNSRRKKKKKTTTRVYADDHLHSLIDDGSKGFLWCIIVVKLNGDWLRRLMLMNNDIVGEIVVIVSI